MIQVAKLTREAIEKAAEVKYMDLLRKFLSSFDNNNDARSLTKPMTIADT